MGDRIIGASRKPLPANPAGPNPADVAARAYVSRYVQQGRARKVSWFNLAKQLNVAEADLRADYAGIFG